MITPPKLSSGVKVAIVSPAGSIHIDYLSNAVNILESWGLKPYVSTFAAGLHHIFSGTVDERLVDLQQALDDPQCKAIFCSRGGYGTIQLVDRLNPDGFMKHPKWIVGFSDITILHAWANYHGIASLHADMPKTFPANEMDTSLLSLKNFLFDGEVSYLWEGEWIGDKEQVEGILLGGNLSVLAGLNGTPYDRMPENSILFIEDLNEDLYHIDRMMHNLKLKGIFKRINAVLVGGFTDMKDSDPSFGKSVKEIILNALLNTNIPVIFDVPAGHQKPNIALPFGINARLVKEQSTIKLYT